MHYLYRYVCILNVFFICVYGQLSAIKNLYINGGGGGRVIEFLLFKGIDIYSGEGVI